MDTEPANLSYVIVSAVGGHIAYSDKKEFSIARFTQEEINENLLSFVHDGGYRYCYIASEHFEI